MEIAVISVHYAAERTVGALGSLGYLLKQLYSPRLINVANSDASLLELKRHVEGGHRRGEVISHNNIGFEFGAYQAGMDLAVAMGVPHWLVFVNDTFHVHQVLPTAYLDNLIAHLGRNVEHPIIAGQIEGLTRSYEFCGIRTHRWVTTNIFALNRAAIKAIQLCIFDAALNSIIVESADPAQFISSTVHPILGEHIREWLFGMQGGDSSWYAAEPLSQLNAERMAGKARSILQEKALAARLEGVSAEFASIRHISFLTHIATQMRHRVRRFRMLR